MNCLCSAWNQGFKNIGNKPNFSFQGFQTNSEDLRVFSENFYEMSNKDSEENIMNESASKNEYTVSMKEQVTRHIQINDWDKHPDNQIYSSVSKAQILDSESKLLTQENSKDEVIRNQKLKHTKYPKRLNLANRSDVVNKCSIRKLRRHFWTLFRVNNK